MLQDFSDITKPPNKDKPVKHDVVHEIETLSCPCHARPRPLSPEKLQIVKEEMISCSNLALFRDIILNMHLRFI